MDLILRFFIGGLVVSAFAIIGDIFRPRSFSGIFGAAPTVALATLGITFVMKGASQVAVEGRSMLLGSAALCVYSLLSRLLLLKLGWHSLLAAGMAYLGWFAIAFGLWYSLLR